MSEQSTKIQLRPVSLQHYLPSLLHKLSNTKFSPIFSSFTTHSPFLHENTFVDIQSTPASPTPPWKRLRHRSELSKAEMSGPIFITVYSLKFGVSIGTRGLTCSPARGVKMNERSRGDRLGILTHSAGRFSPSFRNFQVDSLARRLARPHNFRVSLSAACDLIAARLSRCLAIGARTY